MTREQVDALIEDGRESEASSALARYFSVAPGAAAASFVVSRFEKIAAKLPLTPLRVAILRSFTVEPMLAALRARCYLAGIDASIQLGDYNLFEQELLDDHSALYRFTPDLVLIAALTRDLSPKLWHGDGDLSGEPEAAAHRIGGWIDALRQHSNASVIVQSFEQPAFPAGGVLESVIGGGQRAAIATLNQSLVAQSRRHRGVYVLDYDALASRHGRIAWSDPHKDLAMRVPMRPESYAALADEYMRFIHPLSGRVCKAIAIDLDNTLWGGVVGEDGAAGITLGAEYPGPAYRDIQRQLKALAARGILLTICSKNNPDEAMAVLREHPDMLLRPDDFSAMRINWDDKAENLRQLAAELNIGVDAFAFFDDNPVERDWVRAQLPTVTVIEPGADPVFFADALRRAPVFERLSLSEEDLARTEQYRAERLRTRDAGTGSVDDFLRSLEMVAALNDVTPATLTRVAQLTQKTNQFNATTRRYSEEQVSRFAASPGAFVRTVRVSDRYGDSGLVGVLMGRTAGARCEIDTLLLSCRVIGRGVETVMLADAAEHARHSGAEVLAAQFLPTPKNAPAADVFSRHGFSRVSSTDQAALWELDLTRATLSAPDYIKTAIPS